jgi:hypothetical protein
MKPTALSLSLGLVLLPIACEEDSTAPGGAFDASVPTFDGGTSPDGGGTPVVDSGPATCPAPTGGPTTHGGSVQTETWTAAGSPHILPYDTSVYGVLTLEPCAEILIAEKKSVTVGANAKILATGTAAKPIHIGGKDANPFARITTGYGGTLSFSYVNIDGGGDKLNTIADYTGMLDLQGADQALPTQPILFVDHVTLKGSASNGIVLRTGAGFAPGSNALTVTGSAQYPVSMWLRAIDGLPSGTYTGNTHDEILIPASALGEALQEDATMRERGVPYHMGNTGSAAAVYIDKGSSGLATLTIEPGVVVRMKKGGVIYVERSTGTAAPNGAIIAVGTAAKPIVFTSAEATPAAGDWLGIWFGEIPASTNKIDYARIEYAGGDSASGSNACNVPPPAKQNDAAIRIFGQPPSQFVTNTTIVSSGANGIDRGWLGAPTSFLPTNTFTTVARCTETYPRAPGVACPDPVPCPQ